MKRVILLALICASWALGYSDTLDFPGSIPGSTNAFLSAGDYVAGTYQVYSDYLGRNITQSFVYYDGTYTRASTGDFKPGDDEFITGIDSLGQYIGLEQDNSIPHPDWGYIDLPAFTTSHGVAEEIGAAISLGIGNTGYTDPTDGPAWEPLAINDEGQVTGLYQGCPGGGCYGDFPTGDVDFLWEDGSAYVNFTSPSGKDVQQFIQLADGTFQPLPVPPSPVSEPHSDAMLAFGAAALLLYLRAKSGIDRRGFCWVKDELL